MARHNTRERQEEGGGARGADRALFDRLSGWLWPFTKQSQARSSYHEATARAAQLAEEKEVLLRFIHEMENEFLGTGAGLQRLTERIREVQQHCDTLVGLTLGRGEDSPVPFAFQLLRKAEDLILASYDQYDHVLTTFRQLHRRLVDLPAQHEGLQQVLMPLAFITTSFRIEASRHPAAVQEVFFTLANDVNRLLSEVRETMDRQFGEIAASERTAASLMERVAASIGQHRKAVGHTMESGYGRLRSLHAALSAAGEGASRLATVNQAVARHLGEIVMAQQCQDIARQKIDHVGEAMDEMCDHLLASPRRGSEGAADPRCFVGQAGRIQLQQLRQVFDELSRSADKLTSGMHGLKANADEAGESAVKVGAAMLDAGIAGECQASNREVLAVIDQAMKDLTAVLAAFRPLQASFVNCTDKATALAIDLRHVALNAQIFAIQSADGATLEVLAGRMRVVSDETIQHVGRLEPPLRETAEMVDGLSQRLVDFEELGLAEQRILVDEAAVSLQKLLELETAIPATIGGITEQQAVFARALGEVLSGVQFPETMAAARTRSVGFFQDLVEWGGAAAADAPAVSRKVEGLAANYTMESERRTHMAAARMPPAEAKGSGTPADRLERAKSAERAAENASSPQRPASPLTNAGANDLGDNVELF